MAERSRVVKGKIARFRVRLCLIDSKCPGKAIDYMWLTIRGTQDINRAKAMAEVMIADIRPTEPRMRWVPDIVTCTVEKEAKYVQ